MGVASTRARFGGGAPAAAAAPAVNSRAKDGDNADEVGIGRPTNWIGGPGIGEFGGIVDTGGRRIVCVHNEVGSAVVTNELEQIVCDAAQAVTVGNVNRAYSTVKDASQKPLEAGAAEVDAARDVAEAERGLRVAGAERLDLAFEVVLLLAGGDASVDDVDTAV